MPAQPAQTTAPARVSAPAPGARSLMARLDTQPRVRDFLMRAVFAGRAAHAYLFVGPPGSGKLDAAWALAQALVCEHGPGAPAPDAQDGESGAAPDGAPAKAPAPARAAATTRAVAPAAPCGACDGCIRAAHRTHPDIHYLAPESATGYLVEQVRDLLSDVALSPIRAATKVYIVDRAEQLRANTANALLKTLEEPPETATFILLGTSAETILPTIVSRCQCVPFRTVAPDAATQAVVRATGLPEARCRMAVAVAGSPARAAEFLQSADRLEARRRMIAAIDSLLLADEADILAQVAAPRGRGGGATKSGPKGGSKGGSKGAGRGAGQGTTAAKKPAAAAQNDPPADLLSAIKAPYAGLREAQEAVLEQNRQYFSRGAIKQLEDRNKRELSARERSGIMEALASARSLLRDVLLTCEGSPEPIVNQDAAATVERLSAATTTSGAIRALEAVARAEQCIAKNTSPQLTLEVMLFDIRKALTCPS